MSAPASAAIVTTLCDADAMLDSFVTYHLRTGFAHLFLFFDDPADPGLARYAGHPMVTAIAHDERLRKAWTRLPEYGAYAEFIDREVMARQVLNVALAMDLARGKKLDWLLHIDADELFFSPRRSVTQHFSLVHQQSLDTVSYQNFEGVPEKDDISDAFREVDLFKIPTALGAGPLDEAGRALLAATPQLPSAKCFHFYDNGKSAVRLSAAALHPMGVHKFADPDGPTREARAPDAFILHYACCGFDGFWQKYVTLGRFEDRWLNRFDIRSMIGPLHLDARDAVANGDREAARMFFRNRIAIEDSERVGLLIQQRILTRISGPKEMLNRIAASISYPAVK